MKKIIFLADCETNTNPLLHMYNWNPPKEGGKNASNNNSQKFITLNENGNPRGQKVQ